MIGTFQNASIIHELFCTELNKQSKHILSFLSCPKLIRLFSKCLFTRSETKPILNNSNRTRRTERTYSIFECGILKENISILRIEISPSRLICTVWPSSRLISTGFAHIGSVSLTLAPFRSHWLRFAHIGSVFVQPNEALCVCYFFICTVLTVRSAAPQTALRGGPGPRFELGTGERHWPLNTTASPSIILILCGLCQVCSTGAPGRVQPGWPAAGRVGNSLFGFSCESLVFFFTKKSKSLLCSKKWKERSAHLALVAL